MESTEIQTATKKDETIKTQKAGFSAKTANMLDKIIQPSDRNSQALKERRLHRRIGAITRPHSEMLDQMTYGRGEVDRMYCLISIPPQITTYW